MIYNVTPYGYDPDAKVIELKLSPVQREDAYRAIRGSGIMTNSYLSDGFRWASDRLLERLAEILKDAEVRYV